MLDRERRPHDRPEPAMRNPWTKKNPLMSLWLSAANKVAGSARGQVAAAVRREAATAQAQAARQIADFWTGRPAPAAKPKPARKAAGKVARAKPGRSGKR